MGYNILNPPYATDFRNMKREDVEAFYSWLMEQRPVRIIELQKVVNETAPLEHWCADYTPASLKALGNWFMQYVQMRSRTREEIDKLEAGTRLKGIYGEYELSIPTMSFIVDIALYLGEVMRKQFPHTRWEQALKDKRLDTYGKPVLMGLGSVPFDPIRLITTMAYRISEGAAWHDDLYQLFVKWARHAMAHDPGAQPAKA